MFLLKGYTTVVIKLIQSRFGTIIFRPVSIADSCTFHLNLMCCNAADRRPIQVNAVYIWVQQGKG